MKVIILAGGKGTRLHPLTKKIPKPMILINGKPIILRIIEIYLNYGFNDFIIAGGYKKEIISNYFKNKKLNFKIKIIDTGKNSMTGGRILKLEKITGNNRFLLTYGDAIGDINIKKLINFHLKKGKEITVTGVRPPSRFGVMEIIKNEVVSFKEKVQMKSGWINGGFFVIEPKFINSIKNFNTILEGEPLEKAAKNNKLGCFKHTGFWQCVDTLRDKDVLENYINEKEKNLYFRG